ncbi:MAG TPA: outer membrane beta-barrel protein [Xanthobacteraceae bacterium]|nr:outer membrane beta-barrel protein [Xanthobacteraceae bacterium]
MIKRYLMTSVSCLALTGMASAADMPIKAPAPVVVTQIWAGPYIGINGGAVWHQLKTDTLIGASFLFDTVKLTGTSGTVGGQIGYNWQSQNFVYGVEADANWLNASESNQHRANNGLGFPVVHTTKLSWLATARLRAGVLLAPRTLVFATGGVAVGGVENEWRFVGALTPNVRQDDTRVGWTAGGGIEHFISNPHVTVKAEALYVDFGRDSVRGTGSYTSRFKNSAIVGRLGLNLKW